LTEFTEPKVHYLVHRTSSVDCILNHYNSGHTLTWQKSLTFIHSLSPVHGLLASLMGHPSWLIMYTRIIYKGRSRANIILDHINSLLRVVPWGCEACGKFVYADPSALGVLVKSNEIVLLILMAACCIFET
jgi:hypothetical protein